MEIIYNSNRIKIITIKEDIYLDINIECCEKSWFNKKQEDYKNEDYIELEEIIGYEIIDITLTKMYYTIEDLNDDKFKENEDEFEENDNECKICNIRLGKIDTEINNKIIENKLYKIDLGKKYTLILLKCKSNNGTSSDLMINKRMKI